MGRLRRKCPKENERIVSADVFLRKALYANVYTMSSIEIATAAKAARPELLVRCEAAPTPVAPAAAVCCWAFCSIRDETPPTTKYVAPLVVTVDGALPPPPLLPPCDDDGAGVCEACEDWDCDAPELPGMRVETPPTTR